MPSLDYHHELRMRAFANQTHNLLGCVFFVFFSVGVCFFRYETKNPHIFAEVKDGLAFQIRIVHDCFIMVIHYYFLISRRLLGLCHHQLWQSVY